MGHFAQKSYSVLEIGFADRLFHVGALHSVAGDAKDSLGVAGGEFREGPDEQGDFFALISLQ